MCDSTNGKLSSLYDGVYVGKLFRNFLLSLGEPIRLPTELKEDNMSAIKVIGADRLTPPVCHDNIPIFYIHEQKNRGVFSLGFTPTKFQQTDMGTKNTVAPLLSCLWHMSCVYLHWPSPDTQHFILLDLQKNTKYPHSSVMLLD